MFCPNCGIQIDNPNSTFCFSCGYHLGMGMPNQQAVSPSQRSKLWTREPSEKRLQPNLNSVKRRAKSKGIIINYKLDEYKAKCDYCLHVFSYYRENLGYRSWYQHGFVYCPFCRRPLRHHPILFDRAVHLLIYPDGRVLEQTNPSFFGPVVGYPQNNMVYSGYEPYAMNHPGFNEPIVENASTSYSFSETENPHPIDSPMGISPDEEMVSEECHEYETVQDDLPEKTEVSGNDDFPKDTTSVDPKEEILKKFGAGGSLYK